MAARYPGCIGHMYSPGGERGPWRELPYALDNDAWPAHKNKRPRDEAGHQRHRAVVRPLPGARARRTREWLAAPARVVGVRRHLRGRDRVVPQRYGRRLAGRRPEEVSARDPRSLMIATVAKHFTFDAAHFLDRLPPEHKCHRMHGHTYRVEIQVTGEVDENGFVVDYALIEEAWRTLMDQLDHRVLNDVVGLRNPTTENLAAWILARLGLLATHERHLRVRVYESATTWCEVYASALGELADPTEPAVFTDL